MNKRAGEWERTKGQEGRVRADAKDGLNKRGGWLGQGQKAGSASVLLPTKLLQALAGSCCK